MTVLTVSLNTPAYAGHRHRQAGVQGLVCNLLEVHRRTPNRPREWFLGHQLNKDNEVIGTVWPGKSDLYHATQYSLIPRLDPAVSVAPAMKANANT